MTDAKPFSQAMDTALTAAAASPEQSTKDSTGSAVHKRKFLETFRRWEILFKRKDGGDIQAEKWLIAEYYDSLKHLSVDGFDMLTKRLKETCVFFPTIKECMEATRPNGPYDWSHPFLNKPALFLPREPRMALGHSGTPEMIEHKDGE